MGKNEQAILPTTNLCEITAKFLGTKYEANQDHAATTTANT